MSFRDDLSQVFHAAVDAVQPDVAMRSCLHLRGSRLDATRSPCVPGTEYCAQLSIGLNAFERILVVGCGKASVEMTRVIIELLGERIKGGVVVTKHGHSDGSGRIGPVEIVEAGHPLPDEQSLLGARKAIEYLRGADRRTLVIAPVSGGGSSLWSFPVEEIPQEDLCAATDVLVGCGASIQEINTVRKHLSRIKGGWAAREAFPAQIMVPVISDVIGDEFFTIASGPFAPDPTTFEDALQVIEKYDVSKSISKTILGYLQRGREGLHEETRKAHEPEFERCDHSLCASNALALDGAKKRAEQLGYDAHVVSSTVHGTIPEVQGSIRDHFRKITSEASGPVCILSGGEPTPRLPENHGIGGRNQHLALSMAQELAGSNRCAFLSAGTDGTDGPTDAAGGYVDNTTVSDAETAGIDLERAIREFDSHHALQSLDRLVYTGPTGTNVMDIQILLWEPQDS